MSWSHVERYVPYVARFCWFAAHAARIAAQISSEARLASFTLPKPVGMNFCNNSYN